MTEQLVSVVMPAFNTERYIAQAIRSVLGQTYPHWELIIVDDGSTDNTAGVVRTFKDPRIRYLFQSNAGQSAARNVAVRASNGPLLAFLDSDDLWMSNKLELQMKALIETKADLIYSNGFVFNEDEVMDVSTPFSDQKHAVTTPGWEMFQYLFNTNRIAILSVLLRKPAFERALGFDEEFPSAMEDYDLWLRLAKNGALFHGMSEPLARYRIRAQGSSRRKTNMLRGELAVMEKYRNDPDVDKTVRVKRLRALYEATIAALIEEERIADARRYLWQQARRDHNTLTPLAKALLVSAMPRTHTAIKRLLRRVKASVSYRLGNYYKEAKATLLEGSNRHEL
jgi:teichuronic acid biosynthesis glycosyltransferase TuaG